jgi:AraC-like DNA-binding protein
MEEKTNKTPVKRADPRWHLTSKNFEAMIPRVIFNEITSEIHGASAKLPPTIELDKNLLLLLGILRKSSLRSLDKTTLKLLARAAAAHIVQKQAAAIGPELSAPDFPRFSRRKMRQIEDYVQNALSSDIPVDDIASHVGMSRAQFARRFKATTGITPHQFVMEARVRAAKALMADRGSSLAEIAARTGFASPSHFTTVFQRLVKMTPSVYRMQVSPGEAHTPNQENPPRCLPAMPASASTVEAPLPSLAEFQLEQTSLSINGKVRLLQSSQGLGWTDLFAAVTDELPHEGLHGMVPAIWIVTADTSNHILRCSSAGRESQFLPGYKISITGPGEVVYDALTSPLKARHLYLRQKVIDDVAREMFEDGDQRRVIRSSFGTGDFVLGRLIAAIRASLNEPPAGNRLKIDYLTQALATHLLTRYSVIGVPLAMPVHALNARQTGELSDYINDNLSSNMSVGDLARVVGLGRSQFIQRFKATTAMTPHQYVTLRRIGHARKLLVGPSVDHPLIALVCGFADQSHFIATFKRVIGMTPGEYRRMRLG